MYEKKTHQQQRGKNYRKNNNVSDPRPYGNASDFMTVAIVIIRMNFWWSRIKQTINLIELIRIKNPFAEEKFFLAIFTFISIEAKHPHYNLSFRQ